MLLSVKERLVLLNILPAQESYENMLIVRDLKGELGFSEADHEEIGLVEKDGDVTWDDEKETSKEVSIGPVAYKLIQQAFRKLDSDKLVSVDLIPFYERFVIAEASVEILEEAVGSSNN